MPRTDLPIITPVGPYPTLPVSALALDFVFTAVDTVNDNAFIFTGREIIVVRNTDGGPQTVTLTSAPDPTTQRTGDITTYTVGAGLFSAFLASQLAGWRQSDGRFYLTASNVAVEFAILRFPN